MNGPHHLLLVPGFFGFANLGDFAYFGHVRDYLSEIAPALGIRGEVRVVATIPTASLSVRAARLVDSIAELVDAQGGTVSVIGHSSGGLDARLVVTPDVSLPSPRDVERYARAVRSVVSISAPHHGTPVAHLLSTASSASSCCACSPSSPSTSSAPAASPSASGSASLASSAAARPRASLVEQLLHELLADFSRDRRVAIESFFSSLARSGARRADHPGAMDVFNAATQDRPGVRYGCVVTRARPPGIRSAIGAGISPYAQTTHAVYVALYRIASRTPAAHQPRLERRRRSCGARTAGAPTSARMTGWCRR